MPVPPALFPPHTLDRSTPAPRMGQANGAPPPTTMIYTHVLNKPGLASRSPIDEENPEEEPALRRDRRKIVRL
jgi:hypothetical protein